MFLVAPGGAYEMVVGDQNYDIEWGNRNGFARVAKESKVVSY